MGLYDRAYYREEQQRPPGLSFRAPQTVVTWLVIVNAAFWIADYFVFEATGYRLSDAMGVHSAGGVDWPETLTHPWLWWQLLTYGFAHAPEFAHLLGNMIGLWFLGRDIEFHYGRREFLRLYLVLVVVGGLTWAVLNHFFPPPGPAMVVGASGGVTGVVLLYALNFPRRTVLLFFVIPMPAWVLGAILVGWDILGASGAHAGNVAYSVHLAAAAFAFLYFKFRWNFNRWTSFRIGLPRLRRRPKLRVHDPEREWRTLNREVDRILEKISREGEASLTRKERRLLEDASREFQRRKKGDGP